MSTTTVRIIVVLGIVIIIVLSGFLLFDSPEQKLPTQTKKSEQATQGTKINQEEVTGRWQRTDGGYVIEISAVHNDGTLDAAYYNPNPINVSVSEWSVVDGRLHVYVELSDTNYPGSYYKLNYFAEQDQLAGIYYQAVYKETYDVQFKRITPR